MFYDKLFSSLDFTLPRAATGRRGFPKEAMVCAFIVTKCEGFSQITDLMDYLDNNRLIAHYCGFNIMEPLPSYWAYDRCLRQLDNPRLKSVMVDLVRQLYELGIVAASFIGLDSTPVMANTKQNNPKSFAKSKFSKENRPKSTRTAPWVSALHEPETQPVQSAAVSPAWAKAFRLYLSLYPLRHPVLDTQIQKRPGTV